ncbi:MAG TPA: hypothetical protein ACFYD4_08405 [Candidatus Wunengus sp. YC61]|uniref:hypothetical protein n=1 Tax=Candidatus Wunengus sp. YC61 TaxID=3367698 RepID=UPI00402989F7
MEITKSKSGRVVVDLDGYAEYYRAYISGAITGKVSFPAKYAGKSQDVLIEMAKDCLNDKASGTKNAKYYGGKIIRKAGKVF